MLATRTGSFPIGFRRLSSAWQKENGPLIEWARKLGFAHIDLGADAPQIAPQYLEAGLSIGSADLVDWQGLISPDAGRRRKSVEANSAQIRACAALGIRNFFCVMLPERPELPRRENFNYMIDSLNALGPVLQASQGRMVIEGWPGPGALCCTPESVRALMKECSSENVGLNYDPSHLIRMGIDPLRFLEEFVERVFHVHGKDTEVLSENLYEYGLEQPPVFGKARGFGSATWRYCVPGHGGFRWSRGLEILASRNYRGGISVELEDEHYNGSEQGERRGLIAAGHFLMTC
jgi:sugar phosphate isomerase/epimerase